MPRYRGCSDNYAKPDYDWEEKLIHDSANEINFNYVKTVNCFNQNQLKKILELIKYEMEYTYENGVYILQKVVPVKLKKPNEKRVKF